LRQDRPTGRIGQVEVLDATLAKAADIGSPAAGTATLAGRVYVTGR
jgi:hypothetical protein